jgi:hypothetical protein
MAKGLQKQYRLVFAVVTNDPEESTIGDVQETSKKQPYFLCNVRVKKAGG